jgi:hypothetical protein
MSKAYTGGCSCGAIRYAIPSEPVFMNHCQCRDCQRNSGTGHGSYLTFAQRLAIAPYRAATLPGAFFAGVSPAASAITETETTRSTIPWTSLRSHCPSDNLVSRSFSLMV